MDVPGGTHRIGTRWRPMSRDHNPEGGQVIRFAPPGDGDGAGAGGGAPGRDKDKELVDRTIANIRALVAEKGLVLSHVLEAAGVNGSYLSNIASTKSASPTITKLQRIAEAMHEPLTALFLPGDIQSPRNRIVRILDTLEPQQVELLEAMVTALASQRDTSRP